jgi:hypothetical protein
MDRKKTNPAEPNPIVLNANRLVLGTKKSKKILKIKLKKIRLSI